MDSISARLRRLERYRRPTPWRFCLCILDPAQEQDDEERRVFASEEALERWVETERVRAAEAGEELHAVTLLVVPGLDADEVLADLRREGGERT